jgi:dolichol-phosphate mannosyltransferase
MGDLPALFARDGWQIAHVDVTHRPRGAGASNYTNLQRALVGVVDLFGVAWLQRRAKKSQPESFDV